MNDEQEVKQEPVETVATPEPPAEVSVEVKPEPVAEPAPEPVASPEPIPEPKAEAAQVNPDPMPQPPAPPISDHDRATRWVMEDLKYKENLSAWQGRRFLEAEYASGRRAR